MKVLIKLLSLTIIVTFLLSSCMTTKTQVGQYKELQGKTYKYDKGKQFWIFWGLVPIGRTSVNTPSDGNCEIITKFKFGDFLISSLTGGLLTSYTIKVKAKRVNSSQSNLQPEKTINFKTGDTVSFRYMGKLTEGKVVGVNSNFAIIEFVDFRKKTIKKEFEFEKLTKVVN